MKKFINKKNIAIFFMTFSLLIPHLAFSQSLKEETFKARVINVIEHNENPREDGSISIQQKLKLQGLEGTFKNKEIIATEIVRTFAGSIGLILAVPIATLLAVQFIKKHKFSYK